MKTKRFLATILTLTMIISLLSAFTLNVSAAETSGTADNLTWSFDETTGTLTISGSGKMSDYNGGTAPWSVDYKYKTKSVIIEDGVTYIGGAAFSYMTNMKSITIASSVTAIGNNVFQGCASLESITIPSSVTTIGSHVFMGCTKLKNVEIPSSVTSIGSWAFNKCYALTDIEIPSSITTISGYMFYQCTALTNVTIPSSVTKINGSAFASCTKLATVKYLGENEPTVATDAFNSCSAELKVIVPENFSGTTFGSISVSKPYSINVVVDGNGTAFADSTSCIQGTEVTLTATPDDGYCFKEWQVLSDSVSISDNKFIMPNEAVEIKAVFEKIIYTYTVTFNANGGTQIVEQNIEEGNAVIEPTEPTKTGFRFDGWYADEDLTTLWNFDNDTVSENITLNAKWTLITTHTIEWSGLADVVNKPEFNLHEYMPENADINSMTISHSPLVGVSSPAWNSVIARITLTTNTFDKYCSDTVSCAVNTSNYGTITFNINITLIDFKICSYDNITNGAEIAFKQAGTYTVIFADYDGEKLENVETQEITITETGIVPVSITKGFTLDKDDKIMLWSDMTNLAPKCEAYIVE